MAETARLLLPSVRVFIGMMVPLRGEQPDYGRRAKRTAPTLHFLLHHFFGGASTPEKTSTCSGRRAPRIWIAETAAFSSLSSVGVNRTSAAPMFSSMCHICVVPGMGTIHGF